MVICLDLRGPLGLLARDEGERGAGVVAARRPPHAVHVRVDVEREVEVDDVGHVLERVQIRA